MVRVSPIKLQVGPKVLWFDPNDIEVCSGDRVVVATERGHEFGVATSDVIEVSDELIANLRSPLKPVLRIATDEDEVLRQELEIKGAEALVVFREMVEESQIDMHPVLVEYLPESDKAVFYFESEERVDFRDLVRKLASRFHVRVDMRQIGVRDAARMVGGLGHCGQELCCRRLGGEFSPVSIRMAKEQNLSLNPQKISGACGRLMCCLRYEFETYKEFNAHAPKLGAKVDIPQGQAKVTEVNVPQETIALRLEDGKTIHIPLSEFEEPEEGRRPHVISQETYDKYVEPEGTAQLGTTIFEVTSFTGNEKLADASKRPKRRGGSDERSEEVAHKSREHTHATRKPRRRSHAVGDVAKEPIKTSAKASIQREQEHTSAKPNKENRRKRTSRKPKAEDSAPVIAPVVQEQGEASTKVKETNHRRRRRRSGSSSGEKAQTTTSSAPKTEGKPSTSRKGAVRPGQKSSGLRAEGPKDSAPRKPKAEGTAPRPTSGRKPRHRSRTIQGGSSHASE